MHHHTYCLRCDPSSWCIVLFVIVEYSSIHSLGLSYLFSLWYSDNPSFSELWTYNKMFSRQTFKSLILVVSFEGQTYRSFDPNHTPNYQCEYYYYSIFVIFYAVSVAKLDTQSHTVGNYAGGEVVGASWTDKVFAAKDRDSPQQKTSQEGMGADEDEWVGMGGGRMYPEGSGEATMQEVRR